jgi:D-inositol-3-phosphate glycosyltransferase
LAPPDDEARFARELQILLGDSELRARLGRNARQRIQEKFSWAGEPVDKCLTAYLQLSPA